MKCAHCRAPFDMCSCGLRIFWKNAIIDSVPIEGNPAAREVVDKALREMHIISADEKLIGYREETEFERRGAESYGTAFTVSIEKPDGRIESRMVYAKAIVNPFPQMRTELEVERLRLLESWGIRTPRIYGYGRGTIYQEYLSGDWKSLLSRLKSGAIPDCQRSYYLNEIARIAAILDFRGVYAVDFIRDLWTDGDGRLYYVDAGSDLGEVRESIPPNASRPARQTLVRYFSGTDLLAADEWYRHWYDRLSSDSLGGVS